MRPATAAAVGVGAVGGSLHRAVRCKLVGVAAAIGWLVGNQRAAAGGGSPGGTGCNTAAAGKKVGTAADVRPAAQSLDQTSPSALGVHLALHAW